MSCCATSGASAPRGGHAPSTRTPAACGASWIPTGRGTSSTAGESATGCWAADPMITPGHKRALNQALHELRRPLQALVLLEDTPDRASAPAGSRRGLLELASGALRDLDGALNGCEARRPPERFSSREVVLGCLERWRPI